MKLRIKPEKGRFFYFRRKLRAQAFSVCRRLICAYAAFRRRSFPQRFHCIRHEKVVRIHAEEIRARGLLQGEIIRRVFPAVFLFDIADRKPGRRKAACRSLRAVCGTVVNNEPFKVEYSLCAKAAVKPLQRIFSIVCRCKYCNCRHSSRSFPLQPIKAVLPEQSPAGSCNFTTKPHSLRQP
jgi:hypothetical protein